MCGIAGIVSTSGALKPEVLAAMSASLEHRGPDDRGEWWSVDRRVGLAHRRLAVIDLSAGGHQPMTDAQGEYEIVFNGEIYNYQHLRQDLCRAGHRFRTASDTEVVLEAYRAFGTECLATLNGMFAFALYDAPRRRLFLARDRAGEKPLFFRHSRGRFSFASELKALLADPECPRTLDPASLNAYLAYGYVPRERCILRGVRKLPQGHALLYDLSNDALKEWAYWTLPGPEDAAGSGVPAEAELIDELESLLADSVKLRLIADVPVGIMLSGGIDSSLVTAMAARASRRITTFTIAFPGHRSFDEAPHARLVAQHFGTDHRELEAEPATVDLLPTLARQFDEPLADSSMVPTHLVSRLIRREATVALGGDGGDELFGGYPHHAWVQSQAVWRSAVPAVLRPPLQSLAARTIPAGVKGRNYALGLLSGDSMAIAQFNQLFDPGMRLALSPILRECAGDAPESFKAGLGTPGATLLQQTTATDFRTYLPDDILVKVDRASMLCSLEVRAPWLDPRLIAFAFGRVPDRYRATRKARKVLPRLLAKRLLPEGLDLTRKQGFSLPLNAWLQGRWGSFFHDVLAGVDSAVFDPLTVRRLAAAQEKGYANEHRLFALTMFELWRREYGILAG